MRDRLRSHTARPPLAMALLPRWFRTFLVCQCVGLCLASICLLFVLHPPGALYHSPLSWSRPYANLPRWGVQHIYGQDNTRQVVFGQHKDRIVDWAQPSALYAWGESIATWLAVTLPSKLVPAPLHLVHLLQGPAQLQVLRTLVLLGVPDVLADKVLNLHDLHAALLANEAKQAPLMRAGLMLDSADAALPRFADLPLGKLERLMSFALSIGYFDEVSYRGSHIYVHNAQSVVLRKDHPNNLNHLLFHFSNEAYLAWHNLFVAVLAPEDDSNIDFTASGVAPGIGLEGDAQLGGLYATVSSQQALAESLKRKEEKVASMRAALLSGAAAAPSKPIQTAWQATHKQELWAFFKSRPALERNFAAAMGQIDVSVNRALVADYQWDTLEVEAASANNNASSASTSTVAVDTIVDVGGSEGSFLAAVLGSSPAIRRGVLFDLEGNIAAARTRWNTPAAAGGFKELASAGTQQVEMVAGDFFTESTLPLPSSQGATKYVLRQILHDWTDRDALRILHNLRRRVGIAPNVAVVLIESNKSDLELSPTKHWIDFQMLVCCNGKERSRAQWEALFAVSGWTITDYRNTRSEFAVIEIQPMTGEPTRTAVKQPSATDAPKAPAVATAGSSLKQEL